MRSSRTRQIIEHFIVGVIFLLGLGLRLWQVQTLPGFSFQDGGRDVLVAKRLVAGQASWDVAPASAAIIPNTPLPYWITAWWYALGGLWGVLGWHVLAGTGVMVIAYQTARMVSGKSAGIIALALTALSPELIRQSQMIWPTHAFILLYAAGLLLFLLALKSQKLVWYWCSLLCLWLIKMLHASELPLVLVMEVFLGWFLWNLHRQLIINRYQIIKWVVVMLAGWIVWAVFSFGIVGRFNWQQSNLELHELLVDSQSIGQMIATMASHVRLVTQFVTLRFSILFWLLVAAGMIWMWSGANGLGNKQVIWFARRLGILSATVLFTLFSPSGQVNNWYVSFHSYVVLLLVSMLPTTVSKTSYWRILASVLLVGSIIAQNWYWMDGHLRYPTQGIYADSQRVAAIINTDVVEQNYQPSEVTLLLFEKGEEGKSYQAIGQEWRTGSIQLALEEIDVAYEQRVQVVPWARSWSNILQPFEKIYYVVCPTKTLTDQCVSTINWEGNFASVYLGEFWASSLELLMVYRVILLD